MEKSRIFWKVINSPSLKYVAIRYITYIIQFLNAILLLRFLGAYKYGIYSFIVLFLSYFVYANFGLNYSLNTLLSVYKYRKQLLQKIWSVCCTLNLILSGIVVVLNILVLWLYPSIFHKYEYVHYAVWILLIGLLININMSYVSVYRIYGKLSKINFQQLIPNLVLLLVMLILRDKLTIYEIVYILSGAQLLSLFMFVYKSPLMLKFSYNKVISIVLIKRGIHLLLQTFSFNFITISATTMVGIFYAAEELGYYSLSNTIVNAIVLALGAFMFLLYPKMLNRFANNSNNEIKSLLKKIRDIYILGADYIALLSLLCIPIVYCYMPQYKSMIECFKILTVSQMVLNSTTGYSQLLIARKLEHKMTMYGIVSVFIVLFCSYGIGYFKCPFYYMSFAVLLGIIIYSYLILYKGISCLQKTTYKDVLIVLFNPAKIMAISVIIVSFILNENYVTPLLALLIMIGMTQHKIAGVIKESCKILSDRNLLSI